MLSLGILGGVGAIASARFHLALVETWAERHDAKTDNDFPIIQHVSRPMGLSPEGAINTGDIRIFARWAVDELEGADQIAVVCNSIVPYLPERNKLLTPVAACRQALRGVSRAWLLASESTVRDQIYQRAYPDIEWRVPARPITPWIQDLVQLGFTRRRWMEELDIEDGETIVLGCTELSTQDTPFPWHKTVSPTDEMIHQLCNTPL